MITKKIKLGSFKSLFVLRHRWEKGSNSTLRNYEANKIRRTPRLGIWARRDKVVGTIRKGDDNKTSVKKTFSEENYVNDYYVGFNLIVCEIWINFTFKRTFGFDND